MAHQLLTVDLLPEAIAEFDRVLEQAVSAKKDPAVERNQQAVAEMRRMGVPIPVIRR